MAATPVPRSLCGCSEIEDVLAVVELAAHPFDLVGIDVGRRHLDGRRQVDDQLVLRRRPDDLGDGVADLQRHFQLGAGEAFRRILEAVAAAGLRRHVGDHLRRIGGDLLDAVDVLGEDDAALQFAGRIVEMHDRVLGALQRLEGAGDQLRPALHQHLQRDVVRRAAFLDRPAGKVEIGLRGRRKADLDLREAHVEQQGEHAAPCAPGPSGRSAPGCRRAGRPSTRSAPSRCASTAMCGRRGRPSGRVRIFADGLGMPLAFEASVLASILSAPGGLRTGRRRRLTIVHAGIGTGKGSLAARGGTIDRRALLQRTRRSPIRPRSSRAEESARMVSAAKAGWLDLADAGRVDMARLIQQRQLGGKGACHSLPSATPAAPATGRMPARKTGGRPARP